MTLHIMMYIQNENFSGRINFHIEMDIERYENTEKNNMFSKGGTNLVFETGENFRDERNLTELKCLKINR